MEGGGESAVMDCLELASSSGGLSCKKRMDGMDGGWGAVASYKYDATPRCVMVKSNRLVKTFGLREDGWRRLMEDEGEDGESHHGLLGDGLK